MPDVIEFIQSSISAFDLIVFLIVIYSMAQSAAKGFTRSLLSFSKWLLALIITIILVPKLNPWVQDYIESKFVTDIGLGIFVVIGYQVLSCRRRWCFIHFCWLCRNSGLGCQVRISFVAARRLRTSRFRPCSSRGTHLRCLKRWSNSCPRNPRWENRMDISNRWIRLIRPCFI